jgi:transaldolase
MTKTKLQQVASLGQSIWLDYIQRSLIQSGGLADYVQQGLRGVTSNPAIFEKAIAESEDYDEPIQTLALQGKSAPEIYEELAIEDARNAADILRLVFDRTEGGDGYFSLEVNPHLAHDAKGTIAEAQRLFKAVNRPNIFIKVPGTTEGLLAIQDLIYSGVNVNATLLFSIAQCDLVAEAYLSGLERRAARSYDLHEIASVASLFVSRMDVKVDRLLDALNSPKARALKGQIGIANAKWAYQHFKNTISTRRWKDLAKQGASVQRMLFGSTSTKNPDYSDVLYVDNLIGPDTVNTIPSKTIAAFMDHGTVAMTLEKDLEAAHGQLKQLADLGIRLDDVTRQLLDEGVEKFTRPYDKLIETIAEKQANLMTA